MARGKISISDALKVLDDNNLTAIPKEMERLPKGEKSSVTLPASKTRKVGNNAVTITLQYHHTIQSGGFLVDERKEKVSKVTASSYGPGRVTVPIWLVEHLLYQDQLLKAANDDFNRTTPRSHIITTRRGYDGNEASVGVLVDDDDFDHYMSTGRSGLHIS